MQACLMKLAAEDLMQNQALTLFDLFHLRSICCSHSVGAYIKQGREYDFSGFKLRRSAE